MVGSRFSALVQWELEKYYKRGLGNFFAMFCIISYSYYVPRLFFSLSTYFSGYGVFLLYTVGTYSVHMVAYLLANIFFLFLYRSNSATILNWKINPDPWPWQSNSEFSKTFHKLIQQALVNQIFTMPVGLLAFGLTSKYKIDSEMPSYLETLYQLGFFILFEDISFYLSHRMLHLPWFYKRVHKRHHEFNLTISAAAEYAHPFEYMFGNSIPVAAGPLLFGQSKVHIAVWYTWVTFRTINTAEGHSGFDIPWSPFRFLPFNANARFHDFHHYKNQGNFGSFTVIWDTIFQTNSDFFKHINKKVN